MAWAQGAVTRHAGGVRTCGLVSKATVPGGLMPFDQPSSLHTNIEFIQMQHTSHQYLYCLYPWACLPSYIG